MNKLLFTALSVLFFACSGNDKKSATEQENLPAKTEVADAKKYACPMQCEGTKTYAEAGKCPVCKMDLQEVAMAETDSSSHEH